MTRKMSTSLAIDPVKRDDKMLFYRLKVKELRQSGKLKNMRKKKSVKSKTEKH